MNGDKHIYVKLSVAVSSFLLPVGGSEAGTAWYNITRTLEINTFQIMTCMKTTAMLGLVILALQHCGRGSPGGSVLVILRTLENPQNKNDAGICCTATCRSCDYQLSIWVTCDGKNNDTDCLYGMAKTGLFYNVSEIEFTQDLGNGRKNPLVSNFTSFQGNLGISILARDSRGLKIRKYRLHLPLYPSIYSKQKWTNAMLSTNQGGSVSRISLTYNVHCRPHYYGPACIVGCMPAANYKCNENTGGKLCLDGFVGPNCTCKPSLRHNCDITTGEWLCYPPWHGPRCDVKCEPKNDAFSGYTCDRGTGAKVCLRGWYGKECNETTDTRGSRTFHASSTTTLPRTAISTVQRHTERISSDFFLTKTSIQTSGTPSIFRNMTSLPIVKSSLVTSSSQMIPLMTSSYMTLSYVTSTYVTSSYMTSSYIMSSYIMSSYVASSYNTSSYMMSSMTPSYITSSYMTSSYMTSSYMTSSFMTSSSMTSSYTTSAFFKPSTQSFGLFPSYSFSSHFASKMLEPTGTSMTRDHTGWTENMNPQTSTYTTSDPSKPMSSNVEITDKTFVRTSVDIIGALEVTNYQTKAIRDKTEHLDSTLPTTIMINEHHTSKRYAVTTTPRYTTFKPGSSDARKNSDVWWLTLVPLTVAVLLLITGITIFKKKKRLRREVSPQYHTAMQQFQANADSNERQSNEANDNQQETNDDPGMEDFEKVWKVMSTCHE